MTPEEKFFISSIAFWSLIFLIALNVDRLGLPAPVLALLGGAVGFVFGEVQKKWVWGGE